MISSLSSWLFQLLWSLLTFCLLFLLSFIFFCYILRLYFQSRPVRQPSGSSPKLVVGFFHPYCNGGGGGERVLWQSIHALQALSPSFHILVYTGDNDARPDEILSKAQSRFHLPPFRAPIEFVYLARRSLVEAHKYPRFTMLGQSWGSVLLCLEALLLWRPHVFIDTTGFAFTYPLAHFLFGSPVACYTHYPTISSDMLQLVWQRRPAYNNATVLARNPLINAVKLFYYSLFAVFYSLVGRCASLVLVNSSWTYQHITSLWRIPERTQILYPPCDCATLQELPLEDRKRWIISIGQFRPEKDHSMQLEAFSIYLKQNPNDHQIKLILIGGCRDAGDESRVEALKDQAKQLGIPSSQLEFAINIPFPELLRYLGQATAGLHTMWNEHFGIGVVEFMAAGVIPIAHNSGGPKLDIVKDGEEIGFLASSAQEYAQAIQKVFDTQANDATAPSQLAMRIKARAYVDRFSDQQFLEGFSASMQPFLENVAGTVKIPVEWNEDNSTGGKNQ